MAFTGFPKAAVAFYEGLAADNSRTYWQANKAVYEQSVRAPMEALLAELEAFGPFHVFRPNRDVRFSQDKTPYKDHVAAMGESAGGSSYYVHFGAAGMYAGGGYYHLATDQLERFRAAVDDTRTGIDLVERVAAAARAGLHVASHGELKTAPRGFPKDHPRIGLLRRKGLATMREWPQASWMRTHQVVERVRQAWHDGEAVSAWLDTHVGPSTLPPDDQRW